LNFLDRYSKNTLMSNLMKTLQVGTELFHADRRTDRQDEDNSRFKTLRRHQIKHKYTYLTTKNSYTTLTLKTRLEITLFHVTLSKADVNRPVIYQLCCNIYIYKKIQANMHVHEPNSENIFKARTKRECSFLSNAPPMPVLRSTSSLEAC